MSDQPPALPPKSPRSPLPFYRPDGHHRVQPLATHPAAYKGVPYPPQGTPYPPQQHGVTQTQLTDPNGHYKAQSPIHHHFTHPKPQIQIHQQAQVQQAPSSFEPSVSQLQNPLHTLVHRDTDKKIPKSLSLLSRQPNESRRNEAVLLKDMVEDGRQQVSFESPPGLDKGVEVGDGDGIGVGRGVGVEAGRGAGVEVGGQVDNGGGRDAGESSPQDHNPSSPTVTSTDAARPALGKRLMSRLGEKPRLVKSWERGSFALERRESESGDIGGGGGGGGGEEMSEIGAESPRARPSPRPGSLYASPAAIAAFKPLPPVGLEGVRGS